MTRWATRPVVAGAAAALLTLGTSLTMVGCGAIPTPAVGSERNVPTSSPAPTQEPTTGDSSADPAPTEPSTEPKPDAPDPVSFSSNVKDGKGNVKVSTQVSVTSANGTLSEVKLSYRGVTRAGKQIKGTVAGALNAAKTTWTAADRLEPSSTYTMTTTGKNSTGQSETEKSSFRTAQLSSDQETYATISPQIDSPVGQGMPVILTFDVPIKDKANFQKNLHVQSSPAQEGTWNWLSSTEVRFRPRTWWKPGTKVKAWADINGVDAGGGVYGQRNVSTDFTVSPKSVVTRINLKTHKAKVYINNKLARTIPISAGKPGFATRSGTKLIMDKRPLVRMTGVSIGIQKGSSEDFDLKVRYAMQITASGEYLHAAPWNGGYFGNTNASHGCVGMSTSNAIWLYKLVRSGDPVITTGSSKSIEQGNGYSDWDVSYEKYRKGSAI